MHEIFFLVLEIFLALLLNFLTSLRVEEEFIACIFILLDLLLQLFFSLVQTLNILLSASNFLVKFAKIARRVLDRVLIFVESSICLLHVTHDLIKLLLQAPIVYASNIHDLPLL